MEDIEPRLKAHNATQAEPKIKRQKKIPLEASIRLTPEELAVEIQFLMDPESEFKPDFRKRLANLYSFAFLCRNNELVNFLEKRFSNREIQPPDVTINIIKDTD